MKWAAATASGGLTPVTKTTTYTASANEAVFCSGSAFTVTAPTGASGNRLVVFKTDSSLANIITVSYNGGTTTTVNTLNERVELLHNGTQWVIYDRRIPNVEVSFTPTLAQLGTLGVNSYAFWSRRGTKMFIRARLDAGTVVASEARFDLPSGATTASTTYLPATSTPAFVGLYGRLASSTNKGGAVLAEAAKTYLVFGGVDWQSSSNMSFSTKVNGTSLCSSSEGIMFYAEVPIEGWNG
jgi:hypothetical protein